MTGFADPRLTTRPRRPGAEDGARTRDLNLGKVALYQLSYFRVGAGIVIPSMPRPTSDRCCRTPLHLDRTSSRIVDFEPFDLGHGHDHQLGDPIADLDRDRLGTVVDQDRLELAAISGVDDSRAR